MKPIAAAALGVRTADGSIVLLQDLRPFTGSRAVFTTTADGQRRAVFDFYYRGQDGSGWAYLDSLSLPGIPPARAGEPDLELRSVLEPHGDLRLELRDPAGQRPASFLLKAQDLRQLQLAGGRAPTAERRPPSTPAASLPAAGPQRASARRHWPIGLLALGACAVLAASGLLLSSNTRLPKASAKPAAVPPPAVEVPPQMPPAPLAPFAAPAAPPPAVSRPPVAPPLAASRPPVAIPTAPRQAPGLDYRIRWGDTLWRIAERYYGERELYSELAETNVLNDPDRIIAGHSLQLPPALEGRRRKSGQQ
jgi:nucleoid-associated protein YgaU